MLKQMANMETEIQVIQTENELIVNILYINKELFIYIFSRNLRPMLNFPSMKIHVVLNVSFFFY